MKIVINFICFICLLVSCKEEIYTKISLDDYQKFDFKEERLYVNLLESYKNEKACDESRNANIYVCEDIHTNDTIIVFEPCQKMPDFAHLDYKGERDLTIEKESISNEEINELSVSSDFQNKSNYKYVIGSLTRLLY